MSDVMPAGSAPASGAGPDPGVGGQGTQSDAPVGTGAAPGVGGAGEAAPAVDPAAAVPAKYRILNREFNDQKHAEEVLGAEIGKVRSTQKENSRLSQELTQVRGELDAVRRLLETRGQAPVQGVGEKAGPGDGGLSPENFKLYEQIAQDPNMGLGHAFLAMHQDMATQFKADLEAAKAELKGEFVTRDVRVAQERSVAMAMRATEALKAEFPELADGDGEGVTEVHDQILGILENTPPVGIPRGDGTYAEMPQGRAWLMRNPEQALRWAVTTFRQQYGTPVFAKPPGTSGSPSVQAASAAEAAARASAPPVLDGQGVPRGRPDGRAESFAERIKRESAMLPKEATTPSGRKLGFSVP